MTLIRTALLRRLAPQSRGLVFAPLARQPLIGQRRGIASDSEENERLYRQVRTTWKKNSGQNSKGRAVRNMAEIKKVFTDKACPPLPVYSQAIIAGPQVFVSGQIPADATGKLIEGSIGEKTQQCCDNIKAILAEAGVGVDRIVKVNVFLDDMANFEAMNEVYTTFFTHKPARSCIAAKQLPKGVPVEIECIAYTG